MISARDFVHLPYTADLTPGGIAFCRRALPDINLYRGTQPFSRLRRLVARVAVQLAFQRYLRRLGIPLKSGRRPTFGSREEHDLILGRARCNIIPYLISRPNEVADLRADVGSALNALALIPADRYWADGRSENDVHIFALLSGPRAEAGDKSGGAPRDRSKEFLMHVMPRRWSHPAHWIPLGSLALKSERDRAVELELAGQNSGREFLTRSVELQRRTRVEVDEDFCSLTHLHAKSRPAGRIGISRASRAETYLIEAGDWGDIWVHGTDILLLGWMDHAEFHRRARVVKEGSRVFQFSRTRTKNLGVPVSDLRPLDLLLDRALRT